MTTPAPRPPQSPAAVPPAPSFALARGVVAGVLMAINTIVLATPLVALSLLKLVLPFPAVRRVLDPVLNFIAERWIDNNGVILALVQRTAWDVQGVDGLAGGGWVLVTSNHRSWVDILVLQRVLGHRLPLLKFFLKQELIWVPVLGLAWWALDFPFLRRHGPEALKKRPELKDQDRQSARRACERFRLTPTSVMTFPEGTRFTPAKHEATGRKWRHLLPPKSGALAVAFDAMGPQLRAAVDVTLAYPAGTPTFWDFVCGRCPRVVVRARELPLPDTLRAGAGEHPSDSQERRFRAETQRWIDEVWRAKDDELDRLLSSTSG